MNYRSKIASALIAGVICLTLGCPPPMAVAAPLTPPSNQYVWKRGAATGVLPMIQGNATAVRDRANDRIVVFGGVPVGQDHPTNDTYVRVHGTWSKLETHGAPPYGLTDYAMAYDGRNRNVVLFGGRTLAPTGDETWILDGDTWTQVHPEHSPAATHAARAVYDPVRKNVVLYASYGGASNPAETWTWDGVDWTFHETDVQPLESLEHFGAAWDPVRRAVIVQGGVTYKMGEDYYYGQTWAWDGTSWTALPDGPPIAAQAMARLRSDVIMFGGYLKGGTEIANTVVLTDDGWQPVDLRTGRHPPAERFPILVPLGPRRALMVGGYLDDRQVPHEWILRRTTS